MKILLASALFLLAPMAAHAACSPTDFAVQDFKIAASGGRLSLKGQLVNHCAEPAAAQIAIDAKDSSGKVLASKKGWPAGTATRAVGFRCGTSATQAANRAVAVKRRVRRICTG